MAYVTNMPGSISASATGLDFAKLAEKYGNLTVREVTSSTGGLALAQLVAARAALQLLTLVDARTFSRVEQVPPGGGKTFHFQKVVAVASSGPLTEGTDLVAQDLTFADVTSLIQVFAIRTDVSDLAQRQAAVNLADTIGIAHGNAMNREVNNNVYVALKTNATSKQQLSGAGELDFAWTDLFTARDLVERQRGRPDTYVSGSKKFYNFVKANVTAVQYTAGLNDLLRASSINPVKPTLLGLTIYTDPVYGDTFSGAIGEKYAHILQASDTIGFAQAEDLVAEIQRWAVQVGFRIVSHLTGQAALVMDPFCASIEHV